METWLDKALEMFPAQDDIEIFEGCKNLLRCHLCGSEYGALRSEFLAKKKTYAGRDRI